MFPSKLSKEFFNWECERDMKAKLYHQNPKNVHEHAFRMVCKVVDKNVLSGRKIMMLTDILPHEELKFTEKRRKPKGRQPRQQAFMKNDVKCLTNKQSSYDKSFAMITWLYNYVISCINMNITSKMNLANSKVIRKGIYRVSDASVFTSEE